MCYYIIFEYSTDVQIIYNILLVYICDIMVHVLWHLSEWREVLVHKRDQVRILFGAGTIFLEKVFVVCPHYLWAWHTELLSSVASFAEFSSAVKSYHLHIIYSLSSVIHDPRSYLLCYPENLSLYIVYLLAVLSSFIYLL